MAGRNFFPCLLILTCWIVEPTETFKSHLYSNNQNSIKDKSFGHHFIIKGHKQMIDHERTSSFLSHSNDFKKSETIVNHFLHGVNEGKEDHDKISSRDLVSKNENIANTETPSSKLRAEHEKFMDPERLIKAGTARKGDNLHRLHSVTHGRRSDRKHERTLGTTGRQTEENGTNKGSRTRIRKTLTNSNGMSKNTFSSYLENGSVSDRVSVAEATGRRSKRSGEYFNDSSSLDTATDINGASDNATDVTPTNASRELISTSLPWLGHVDNSTEAQLKPGNETDGPSDEFSHLVTVSTTLMTTSANGLVTTSGTMETESLGHLSAVSLNGSELVSDNGDGIHAEHDNASVTGASLDEEHAFSTTESPTIATTLSTTSTHTTTFTTATQETTTQTEATPTTIKTLPIVAGTEVETSTPIALTSELTSAHSEPTENITASDTDVMAGVILEATTTMTSAHTVSQDSEANISTPASENTTTAAGTTPDDTKIDLADVVSVSNVTEPVIYVTLFTESPRKSETTNAETASTASSETLSTESSTSISTSTLAPTTTEEIDEYPDEKDEYTDSLLTPADPIRESTQQPDANSTKTPEVTVPERGLHWGLAKQTWQYAWEIHIYTFGALFGLLALYTVVSGLRLSCLQGMLPRGYFLFINALMFLMCSTRCFYMLFDGYNSDLTFHSTLDYFMYSITSPCLTSAFSLLVLAFLKATSLQLLRPAIQNIAVLLVIIAVHFALSVSADVLIGYQEWVYLLQFAGQVFYLVWGAVLFFGYAYIFRRLYSHALKRQKNAASSSPSEAWVSRTKIVMKFTLSAGIKVTFFAAICGLVTVGLEVYAIVDIYRPFTPGRPKAWPWWLYHTVLRVIELLMALSMTFVASLPFRYSRAIDRLSCGIFCAPCAEMCSCCGGHAKSRNAANRSSSFYEWHAFGRGHAGPKVSSVDNGYNLRRLSSQDNPEFGGRPSSGSRPSSLLIIDNGVVRFQTNEEVCVMLDGGQGDDQKEDIHSMNTFHLRDSFFNPGYCHNLQETYEDEVVKSRKSSMTSSEFFRVPSSVSLADSVENELDKVFESFKVKNGHKDVDNRSTDVMVGSTLSTDPNFDPTDIRLEDSSGLDLQSSQVPQLDDAQSINSETELSTPFIQHDEADVEDFPPPYDLDDLPDAPFQDNESLVSSGSDDFIDHNGVLRTRRPSEGHGYQAAILTSLLKSRETGSTENIDV
uniref:Proline-rich transmembrane protein 3/4 domain-containing protein n=1 Tax=Biomphalaria glabrata TaxID=6526 RepID=A0A2C9KAW3_BIOGL